MTTEDELSDILTTVRANYVASLERRVAEQRGAMERAVKSDNITLVVML